MHCFLWLNICLERKKNYTFIMEPITQNMNNMKSLSWFSLVHKINSSVNNIANSITKYIYHNFLNGSLPLRLPTAIQDSWRWFVKESSIIFHKIYCNNDVKTYWLEKYYKNLCLRYPSNKQIIKHVKIFWKFLLPFNYHTTKTKIHYARY